MAAGESARDVARRNRQRAARLESSAANWERGGLAESDTARELEQLGPEWTCLHDLAWPGRPRANIDHVVIGPGGVFVVDTKDWSGTVTIENHDLCQNGRLRDKALDSVRAAAAAIGDSLPIDLTPVPVLCFASGSTLAGRCDEVLISAQSNIVEMLTTRPATLTTAEQETALSALSRAGGTTERGAAETQATERRSRRPSPAVRSARERRRQRKDRAELRRALVSLAAMIAFIVVITQTDLLQTLSQAISDALVDQAKKD